ncbi:mbt repeat domain-containing protein [Ditylenchus destructor]|uniref:Mbt repeat domain-containing protein n=1 Tax=Ditylenchus destructor TaxID=166010 RepID=A0AAD4R8Z0_9BILA|nr:mbt repeat domain-containing protein [Ditylenchus destructor]
MKPLAREFRATVQVQGIHQQEDYFRSYNWKETLHEALASSDEESSSSLVLDVKAFDNPTLSDYLTVMNPGIKVEVKIHDYDATFKDQMKEVYWIATVKKIFGYYLLCRYEGMDQEGDESFDFWINMGSTEMKNVGYSANGKNSELIPPKAIRKRQNDWSKYIVSKLHESKTLNAEWEEQQSTVITEGKFKVGHRLELLDRQISTHVRPAQVIEIVGRRIKVKVREEDLEPDQRGLEGSDDIQETQGIWMDQTSGLIFPVGWAVRHSYGLLANKSYREHCQKIVDALSNKEKIPYEEMDVTQELIKEWTEDNTNNSAQIHWKPGMKFECLDPLNSSFLELRVATCIELLGDEGYLKIGFDGPEMEEETIPIHCTSPFLFPVGYAEEFDIFLRGPSDTTDFSWKEYLRQSKSIVAPDTLFDTIPTAEEMTKFKIGAKLEAADLCEPNLICPATLVDIKGRLLRVHFDGWDDDIDQLFDYRSHDIHPVGWCDMHGYKLEYPKGAEQPPKKKKK